MLKHNYPLKKSCQNSDVLEEGSRIASVYLPVTLAVCLSVVVFMLVYPNLCRYTFVCQEICFSFSRLHSTRVCPHLDEYDVEEFSCQIQEKNSLLEWSRRQRHPA